MGSAFKARDFDVNTLSDGSAGQLSGAIGLLTEKLKAIPDVPVAIYFCGYVAARGGRPFLLPISAALERPSDVMTQGILAKSIVDVVAGSGPRASLIMLEAVAVPNAAEPMALASLDRPDLPAGMGLLGVSVTAGDSSLRFVATLLPRLKADAVKIPDLISDFKQDPDGQVTAAIRRFQHELQVPMTGRLTGAQAGKLMTIR